MTVQLDDVLDILAKTQGVRGDVLKKLYELNPEDKFYTPPPFKVCDVCDGDGVMEERNDGGEYWPEESCEECNGTGRIPIWYNIPQWEELTGRKVPYDMPVVYRNHSTEPWRCDFLCDVQGVPTAETFILIATEAGRPPKDWRQE